MSKKNTYRLRTVLSTLVVLLAVSGVSIFGILQSMQPTATALASEYLNFQARLKNGSGAVVPDGDYNVEFKIFDASSSSGSSQGSCSGDSNCLWTETRTGGNKVRVVNGYMTANLGSVTALPNIDWSQRIYLSMNIGGTGSPSWDGEMSPRLLLTAVPLAFKANNVGSAATNSASTNSSNVTINSGNATGSTSNSGNISIDVGTATGTAGTITLGASNASAITLGRTGLTLTIAGNETVQGGTLTVGTTSQAGNLVLYDGSSNTGTIQTAALGSNEIYILPDSDGSDTICLLDLANCAGAGSGVTTVGAIDSQTKSVNGAVISGTTIYLQNADIDDVGLVSIGTQTFNGVKTFDDGIILAANQSLSVTGGTTVNRPGSPTEGMIFYDTDTNQTLVYNNGKWQADRADAVLVAASNSTQAAKDAADFVADGTDDQVQINAALNDADPAGSGRKVGKVLLFPGTYVTHRTDNSNATILVPDNTTLAGSGRGTLIELGNLDVTDNLIENSNTSTGTGVVIRDMRIDGRDDLNTAGEQHGIYFSSMGDGNGASSRAGGRIENVWAEDFRNTSFRLSGSDNNVINNVFSLSSTDAGIILMNASQNNIISNVNLKGAGSYGVYLDGSTYNTITNSVMDGFSYGVLGTTVASNNTITGNTVENNTDGIYFQSGSNSNLISGNSIQTSGTNGIFLTASTNNSILNNSIQTSGTRGIYLTASANSTVISGNTIANSGGASANNGIVLDATDSTVIMNNVITDTACAVSTCYAIDISNSTSDNTYLSGNRYTGDGTDPATINDAGTGTFYSTQLNATQILQSGSSYIRTNASTVISGSIDPTASASVTGVSTKFLSELQIGDRITVTGETRTVTAISSDTALTVELAFSDNADDTSVDRLPAALRATNSSATNLFVVNDNAAYLTGGLAIQGTGTVAYTDPSSTFTNNTRVNMGNYTASNFDSILSLGLNSGSSTTSRAIQVFDNRAAGNNTAPLAVFSPDLSNWVGFSWDGQNTVPYLKSSTGVAIKSASTVLAEFGTTSFTFNNPLQFTGTGTVNYTTPQSSSIGTKIGIATQNPGQFAQVLAFGIGNTAHADARVLSLFDNRSAGDNDPALAVWTPDETDAVGFSSDGSNSYGYLKATSGIGIGIKIGSTVAAQFETSGALALNGPDNAANAFDLQQGSDNYINLNTTNGSENISFGNATTNPSYSFLGVGNTTFGGNVLGSNAATGTTGTTTGTGTTTTTLTLTTDAFAVNDVVLIDNAGQDYYTRITVDPGTGSYTVSPAVTFETGRTVTKYTVQNLGATASDYATLSNRFFQGYFLGGVVTGAGSTSLSDGLLQSTGAFTISATSLTFSGLTSNLVVGTSDTTATLFVVDTKTDAEGGLSGTNGAIYYNSNSNKFRCYQNGAWTDCITNASGITSGDTASRPGSPTEGQLYYDTDTDMLLVYSNGKWQADRTTARKIVAASNSSQAAKDSADYIVDGTSDQTEINSALTAASGGVVFLTEGTFTISDSISIPNNTTLAGAGRSTIVQLADLDATAIMITNTDISATTHTGITIRDMRLDGRNDINTSGSQQGIVLDGSGGSSGTSARQGSKITGVYLDNFSNLALWIKSTSNNNTVTGITVNDSLAAAISGNHNTVTGSIFQGNSNDGLRVPGSNNTITGNTFEGNTNNGIYLQTGGSNITVSGNTMSNNGVAGIKVETSTYNQITGNTVNTNTTYGIQLLTSANYNTIEGNKVHGSGGTAANNGIYLDASDANTITNNTISDTSCDTTCAAINISNSTSDNNYLEGNRYSDTDADSGDDAGITDAGTGTTYGGQSTGTASGSSVSDYVFRGDNSATAFRIQNASGTSVLTVDTSTAGVSIGGTLGVSGAATFTSTISVEGNTTIGNSNSDTLTVNAGTSGSGIRFADATLQGCTALETDAQGDLTCGSDTDTLYTAGLDLDLNSGAFDIESQLDNVSVISRASANLTLQTTTTGDILVNAAGNFNVGNGDLVVNSSGNTAVTGAFTSSGGAISLNASSNNNTSINTGTSTGTISLGNSAAGAITLQSASTIGLTGTTSITGLSTGVALTVSNSTSTGNVLTLNDNATAVFTVADGGAVLAKNTTNTATAFQIQNSTSGSVFTADTTDAGKLTLLGNYSPEPDTWGTTTVIPTDLTDVSIIYGNNGYVYQIGGTLDTSSDTADVRYAKVNADGTFGSWTNGTDLPHTLSSNGAVVYNGYIYVTGGWKNGGAATNEVLYIKINPDGTMGSSWTTSSNSFTNNRYYHVSVVARGYLYVMGGIDSTVTYGSVYKAQINPDGSLGTFSSTTSIPQISADDWTDGMGGAYANGRIYLSGGGVDGNNYTNDVRYGAVNLDGTISSWTTSGNDLPASISYHTMVASNGYLYAMGGQTAGGSPTIHTTVYYSKLNNDGSIGSWTNSTNVLASGTTHASSFVANGYVYVAGGRSGALISTAVNTVRYSRFSGVVQVAGNLDLIGSQAGTLADGSFDMNGAMGGSITASNGVFVGSLQVQGAASFNDGLSVQGPMRALGGLSIGAPDTTGTLLILDTKTDSGDPTGINGGMYYNSNAGKFRCYQNSAWADCLTPWIQIKKTADQDVTNSATYADDNTLQFSVTAATTYVVRFYICYTGTNATADYKGQFTFPAAIAAKNVSGRYIATATNDVVASNAGVLGATTTFPSGGLSMGTAAATTDKRIFEGVVTVQPNGAGTFKYQFAQNSQTAANSARTCANSYIEYMAL